MDLTDRMVFERKYRKLSRKSVAKEMGITVRTLWKLETGRQKITTDHLDKFAYVIGCEILILFNDKNK